DSDNDGMTDLAECGGSATCTDTDSDGIADNLESNTIDTDGDGNPDYNDSNADGEGGNDGTGGEQDGVTGGPWNDVDNDGIPDHLDADVGTGADGSVAGAGDSDGDGISDAAECPGGYICPDSDSDGIPDYMDDFDNSAGRLRLLCVNPLTETVKIKNFTGTAVDISGYSFCSKLSYSTALSTQTLVSGSLNLMPGMEVEIQISSFNLDDTAADLGLYSTTSGYGSAANMVDFTQWGSGGNGRESVAVTKGIWTAGTYISPNENPEFCYEDATGVGNGAIHWKGNLVTSPTEPGTPVTVCGDTNFSTDAPFTANDCLGNTSGTANPNGGAYTIDANGCITYTAPANPTTLTDTVCLVICDNSGLCDTTHVVFPIDTSANPLIYPSPVDPSETVSICGDTTWSTAGPITASDCSGGTSGTANPVGGAYTIDAATGCIDYTAPANPTGTKDTVCLVICDANGICDTTSVIFPIDTSSAPTPATVDPGMTTSVCLDTNWVTASPIMTMACGGGNSGTAMPNGGNYSIDADGCVMYTAPANPSTATDTACVIICDANGVCDTTNVVFPINLTPVDTDGDGDPDVTDPDDDNDGILDTAETGDTDNDGIPDSLESNIIDSDGDGTNDYADNNADDDGANDGTGGEQDGVETGPWNDTDNDGIPDHLDGDDGSGTGTDITGTGDTDGDGLSDAEECPSGFMCPDSDGDGIPDYADTDSDNDGITDATECPTGFPCTDTDNDGIADNIESNTQDTDGDGMPDYNDTNADGDSPDTDDSDDGGTDNGLADADNDGIPNYLDADNGTGADGSVAGAGDSDGDGLSDAEECPGGVICPDTDGDGQPDYMDIDSDGDGINDIAECPAGTCPDTDSDGITDNLESNTQDTDMDGQPDYNDADADGDSPGTNDSMDTTDGLADADGDGIPNYLDADNGDGSGTDITGSGDSDGDGISDATECPNGVLCPDSNNNGTPDYMESDVGLNLEIKVLLSGAYNTGNSMMSDDLRAGNLIPTAQPYNALMDFAYAGTETVNPTVFSTTGNDAIVDWILVELRDAGDPTSVVETRAGLLQRDGDIVDTDGTSALSFTSSSDDYYVAVRHRNHLGCMTQNTVALSSSATTIDFSLSATMTYQLSGTTGSVHARQMMQDGAMALWVGNYSNTNNTGDRIIFQGADSDADAVFFRVLTDGANTSFLPVHIVQNVYNRADGDLDGRVILQGAGADTDFIFFATGLHPENTGSLPIFVIYEQIPRN
ncbi:MAG: hypothetical protein AAF960_15590, partial [Bacteroidota bacterium]